MSLQCPKSISSSLSNWEKAPQIFLMLRPTSSQKPTTSMKYLRNPTMLSIPGKLCLYVLLKPVLMLSYYTDLHLQISSSYLLLSKTYNGVLTITSALCSYRSWQKGLPPPSLFWCKESCYCDLRYH